MADKRPTIDTWPLLPRRLAEGATRAPDEPARAAVTAAVALAAVLLVLRALPDPALAREFATLVANIGFKGSFAVTVALMVMLFSGALISPMPLHPELRRTALAAFDHGVHLGLVLTVTGLLAVIVLHGGVSRLAVGFTFQAVMLMGCYRARGWFARRTEAS